MLDILGSIISKHYKSPTLYYIILLLITVILFAFPFVYANVFFYGRMLNRIEILSHLSELDLERIKDNEILMNEYYAILQAIDTQRTRLVGGERLTIFDGIIVPNGQNDRLRKFISGGALA
ncbi:MAG: hypothetical protein FWF81_10205 [Defluviitaleaceae bacterium]|nr:hypothetical protein [Defluviitaleaceae bacterium]